LRPTASSPEQEFLSINECDAFILVVEREQRCVVRRGNLEEEINLRCDRAGPQKMIGAPQQANAAHAAAPIGIKLIGKAHSLGRLVDDPSDAGGFDRPEIGDVVVMRKVNNQRVDRNG
jgi:hypothetical protein